MEELRADYWKSQARKYCDFCKCWIADNKPSVEFHEKGRRHQDNVAKRLKTLTKKSRRDELENEKMGSALAQMESAALEAYRRDVESNADLTSIAINRKLADENLAIAGSSKVPWQEAKSDEGHTYYWNVLTNETVWEPPKEGFVSLNEQAERSKKSQWKEIYKKQVLQDNLKKQELKQDAEEERAKAAREKLKERRVESLEPVVAAPLIDTERTGPYGKWNFVQEIAPEPVNEILEELPDVSTEPQPPPQKEFKEKMVESLGSDGTTFKKRKMNFSNKRNARARLDDD